MEVGERAGDFLKRARRAARKPRRAMTKTKSGPRKRKTATMRLESPTS